MAEFVQERMEEMVPILEKIHQTGLVSPPQLKKWVSKCRRCEESIQRPARTTEDYKTYLELLASIYKELGLRRAKNEYFHHRKEIEDSIRQIIRSRVGSATTIFQHDYDFFNFLVSYFKGMEWWEQVSKTWSVMIQNFGKENSKVYIYASIYEWEHKVGKGIEQARKVMNWGVDQHKDDLSLRLHMIGLECLFVEYLIDALADPEVKRKHIHNYVDSKQLVEDLPLVKVVYHDAEKHCKKHGVRFYTKVYQTVERFEFIRPFLDEVLHDARREHPEHEGTVELYVMDALRDCNLKKSLDIQSIRNAIEIYEAGLKRIPTVKMYEKYLARLNYFYDVSLNSAELSEFRVALKDSILELYSKAHEKKVINIDIYMGWLQFVRELEEQEKKESSNEEPLESKYKKHGYNSNEILNFGIQFDPTNWLMIGEQIQRIFLDSNAVNPFEMKKTDRNKVIALYKKIVDPESKSFRIWEKGFVFFLRDIECKDDFIGQFIGLAPIPIKYELSKRFIHSLFIRDQIITAEEFYKFIQYSPGFTENLHLQMAKMYTVSLIPDERRSGELPKIATLHELSVENFGKNSLEPWKEYMTFERDQVEDESKVSRLFQRALRALTPELREELQKNEDMFKFGE